MKSQPKKPKFVARETRRILAANLRRRMDQVFDGAGDKPALLAARVGTSKSTIQRILNAEVGVTIDILTQFAMGLRCDPADLLRQDTRQTPAK